MNKVYGNTCIWCSSPCVTSLFNTSEDCSNPKCRAYTPTKPEEIPGVDTSGVQTGRTSAVPTRDWKKELRDAAKRPNFSSIIETLRMKGTKIDSEVLRDLGIPEEDAKKILEIYKAKKGHRLGAMYGRSADELVEAMSKAGPVTGHTSVGHVAPLDYYARADAESTKRAFEERQFALRETYMQRRLRWPRTMRVMKRADGDTSFDKKNQTLLGILSFVDAPYHSHKENAGLIAFYDYIMASNPVAGRCRVEVHRHTEDKLTLHLDDGMTSVICGKIFVLLKGHDRVDTKQIVDLHLGEIAREFDLDLKRDREPRRMDGMEKFFMERRLK